MYQNQCVVFYENLILTRWHQLISTSWYYEISQDLENNVDFRKQKSQSNSMNFSFTNLVIFPCSTRHLSGMAKPTLKTLVREIYNSLTVFILIGIGLDHKNPKSCTVSFNDSIVSILEAFE